MHVILLSAVIALSGFGAVAPVWSPGGEMICYVQHTHDERRILSGQIPVFRKCHPIG